MSVFGVDLGNLNSTIGVTRNGGIDIIINEVSKRETSTIVSMTEQERFIGESGLDRAVRNANNTIACVKRFIGAHIDDPALAIEKRYLSAATSSDDHGRLMFDVNYNNDSISLYPEQVLAMFVQQLRKYVNLETTVDPKVPADVRDCVVTIPCYYTAEQRRLVIQACEIAGVNAMSLVNETTASSIDYGIFRGASLPEKESDAQVVAILDVGYGTTTVAVTAFWRGNLKVLSRKYDKNLGTRDVDWTLYERMAKEIMTKYKVDVTENKRARIRLLQACEKVKYLLSGNQFAPLNIENLMDIDVNIPSFPRAELEELCTGLVDRLKVLISSAVEEAGLSMDKLHSVEFIGGGCRIPMFKKAVEEVAGKAPSFTLNASESVARGAAITAAVFSPKFQVREFVVNDKLHYPIKLGYQAENPSSVSTVSFLPNVNKVLSFVGKGDYYPKTLEVTIKRTDTFQLYAFYDDEDADVQAAVISKKFVVGEWTIGGTNKTTNGEVRLRLRVQPTGLITLESAQTTELYEVQETEEKKDPENPEKEAEKVTVTKQKSRKMDLSVQPNSSLLGHAPETIIQCRKLEEEMNSRDLLVMRTKDAKNELESYILDNRSRVSEGGAWFEFLTEADRAQFLKLAAEYEEWLYDDGSESTLEEYKQRTQNLKNIGGPAFARWKLYDDIPFELKQFVKSANQVRDNTLAAIGKHAHITEEELRAVATKVEEAIATAERDVAAYQAAPKTNATTLSVAQFATKLKELESASRVVLTKPVPKPPKAETPPPKAEPAADASAKAEEEEKKAETTTESAPGPVPPSDLD
jgi:molecular chaperone DnaK (HSP70)